MVGGFSESPFLKSVIKNSFEQGTSNMEEEKSSSGNARPEERKERMFSLWKNIKEEELELFCEANIGMDMVIERSNHESKGINTLDSEINIQ